MQTATVLAAAGAFLLLATGLAKLRRPAPTADVLVALRWRFRVPAALALGAGEVVVGALVVGLGGPVGPALECLLYAAFGAYVLRGLRSAAGASCGCSGHDDTPVTALHLTVNALFAAATLAAALARPEPLLRLPAGSLVAGAVLAAVLAAVGWLAVTVHPQLVAARGALRSPAGAAPAVRSVVGEAS